MKFTPKLSPTAGMLAVPESIIGMRRLSKNISIEASVNSTTLAFPKTFEIDAPL